MKVASENCKNFCIKMLDDSIDEQPKKAEDGRRGNTEICRKMFPRQRTAVASVSCKPLLDLWNMLRQKQKVSIK